MYLSLLIVLLAVSTPVLAESDPELDALTEQELSALESACYGWDGEAAYQQVQASGRCALLGMDPGERSAFRRPPQYQSRGGE